MCWKLESVQMRVSRELFEASSRVAGAERSRVEEAGGEEGRDESVVW